MSRVLNASPRILFSLVFVLCIVTMVYYTTQVKIVTYIEDEAIYENEEELSLNFQECNIPEMIPFDESIVKFIFEEANVTCNNGIPALIDSDSRSISLVETSLPYYNITDFSSLKCCYIHFWREEPRNHDKDKKYTFDPSGCQIFNNTTLINDEFIKVSCYYNSTKIYDDYFSFVPAKTKENPEGERLNVLVIGLDGVSRMNFHRQMPKTSKLLEDLDSVELLGYNKVGDNTFPNLIPVLTGLSVEELGECWPSKDRYLDDCPFVWKTYKEDSFTTLYAEDCAAMSSFHYIKLGFKKQPTDYYWYPFALAAKENIGNAHRLNVDQCFGAREQYQVLLDYTEKFVSTMHENNKRYFGFFWENSLSHDVLNKPKLGDSSYHKLITHMNTTGMLNNTVMIVMSDHGMRYSDIRHTYQGMLEERLPYISVYLPPQFKQKFPQAYINLSKNSRRLTTPYDLHQTLLDLVKPSHLPIKRDMSTRAISLFSKIPRGRSCDSAGIPENFCTCKTGSVVNITDDAVVQASNVTVRHINEQLRSYDDCVTLEMDGVLNAQKMKNMGLGFEYYAVMFNVTPSGAVFEAMVKKSAVDEVYDVIGTVSRLNLYGDQSVCVGDPYLKLFCYCRKS